MTVGTISDVNSYVSIPKPCRRARILKPGIEITTKKMTLVVWLQPPKPSFLYVPFVTLISSNTQEIGPCVKRKGPKAGT